MVKTINTFNMKYIEVESSNIVEIELKRSYWREKKQDQRYWERRMICEDINCIDYVKKPVCEDVLCNQVIRKEEINILMEIVKGLDDKSKFIIYSLYFRGLTMTEVSKSLGVTVACVSQKHKLILRHIKEEFLHRYSYYI